MSEIHLGDEVRDIITGCEGVAIQRLVSLFGVPEIAIQQRNLNGDERPLEKLWFAEAQLERKKKTIHFADDGRHITEEELRETRTYEG